MLAFNCPACRTTINLPDSARGERIVCGHCGESVFVAASTTPRETTRQTLRESPQSSVEPGDEWPDMRYSGPRRSIYARRKQQSLLPLLPLIAISAVTTYAAWRMYDATVNRPPEPAAPSVAVAPPKVMPRRRATPPPQQGTNVKPVLPVISTGPTPPPTPKPPKSSNFADFPTAIELPALDYGQMAVIATPGVDCKAELASNSTDLTQDGDRIFWKGDLVAGLRVEEGALQFRWMKDVPTEAEAAICNSIVRLRHGDDQRVLALREPAFGEPLLLDLKSAKHRVNCKCNWMPEAEEIRLAISLPDQLPVKSIDGPSVNALKDRDETILIYRFGGDAATKVTVKKAGETLAATFASQYVLPSGDVEPLAIARGSRVMKDLVDLQTAAVNAREALPKLRRYKGELQDALRRVMNQSTGQGNGRGAYIENPVAAGQRFTGITQIQNEIAANENNIARAMQLIDNEPSVRADLDAMRAVEDLAKSINNSPLAYRFYILVDGHEVDLVSWSPEKKDGGDIPAVLAQPIR